MGNAFEPTNALVIGATRGIGLALTAEILERFSDVRVHATWRRRSSRGQLDALQARHGERLQLFECDLALDEHIQAVATQLRDAGQAPELVVHAAGILHEPGVRPEKAARQVDRRALHRVFDVNTFAPLLMASALLPLLPRVGRAHYAALSAMIGSITDNRLGGWYGYRASKAALNQALKTFAIEARRTRPGLCVSLVHPGTTDTDLSRPFQGNVPDDRLYRPQQTARRVLDVILAGSPEDTGRFMNWDGRPIPF